MGLIELKTNNCALKVGWNVLVTLALITTESSRKLLFVFKATVTKSGNFFQDSSTMESKVCHCGIKVWSNFLQLTKCEWDGFPSCQSNSSALIELHLQFAYGLPSLRENKKGTWIEMGPCIS